MTYQSDTDPKQDRTAASPPGMQCPLPDSPDRRVSDIPDLLEAARALHEDAVRSERAAGGTGFDGHAIGGPLAAITCMVVTGDPRLFSHDARTAMDLVQRPAPENGWRSQSGIRNDRGQRMDVEQVSTMGTAGLSRAAGTAAHRAQALCSIGEADLRLVERERDCPADHALDGIAVDGCGVVDLVQISGILDRLEPCLFADGEPAPARRVRRIHGFPTVEHSGSCDLVLRIWSGPDMHFRTISIRSHVRRTGSREIMAVCETLYRR